MPVPKRIYLDTNLIYGWFKNQLNPKKHPKPEFIEFLCGRCKGVEKFISIYSIAELLVNLKKDFQDRGLSEDKISPFFEILKDHIGLKIIIEAKLTNSIVTFADLCNDHNDAVHIEIAKNENLTFVTRDEDIGKVGKVYKPVMCMSKFMKQFD